MQGLKRGSDRSVRQCQDNLKIAPSHYGAPSDRGDHSAQTARQARGHRVPNRQVSISRPLMEHPGRGGAVVERLPARYGLSDASWGICYPVELCKAQAQRARTGRPPGVRIISDRRDRGGCGRFHVPLRSMPRLLIGALNELSRNQRYRNSRSSFIVRPP